MLGFGKITAHLETIESQLTTLFSRHRLTDNVQSAQHEEVMAALHNLNQRHAELERAVVTHQHVQAEPETVKAEPVEAVAREVAPDEEEKAAEPVEETSPAQAGRFIVKIAEADTSADTDGTVEPEEDASESEPEPTAA